MPVRPHTLLRHPADLIHPVPEAPPARAGSYAARTS